MTALGVGLVGAGAIGESHAEALREIAEARLVAVAEPREDAGRALAREHDAEWHAGIETLLARADVDVVLLATPSGLHPDQAVRAAGAGKHVITEKPMAITLDGADRMIAACRRAGVALAAIFQNRCYRDAVRLKRAVEEGCLGTPVLANALVYWHRAQEYYGEKGGWRGTWALDGGGALMNQSIHTIDLLQWVMGPVESLSAYAATLAREIEAEDTASASVRFESGALGCIQGATSTHRNRPATLQVFGTEGAAVLEGGKLAVWEPGSEPSPLSAREFGATLEPEEGAPWSKGHEVQLRETFRAILDGRAPPVSGEEGRKALELVLAVYESARTGERVVLRR